MSQEKAIVFQPGQNYRFKKNVPNPITLTDEMGLNIKMVQTKAEDAHIFTLEGSEAQRYVGDLAKLAQMKPTPYVTPLP